MPISRNSGLLIALIFICAIGAFLAGQHLGLFAGSAPRNSEAQRNHETPSNHGTLRSNLSTARTNRGSQAEEAGLQQFKVVTNSMAPGIVGRHFNALCPNCKRTYVVAAEALRRELPCTCSYCAADCSIADQSSRGDIVRIVPLERPSHAGLHRFDVVAAETPGIEGPDMPGGAPLLKRIWGLPGEQVATAGGEFWIDGRLLRKPIAAIRTMSPLIDQLDIPGSADRMSGTPQSLGGNAGSLFSAQASEGLLQVRWQAETPRELTLLSDDGLLNQGASYVPLRTSDILLTIDLRSISMPANQQSGVEDDASGPFRIRISWTYGFPAREVSLELVRQGHVQDSTASEQAYPLIAKRRVEVAFCDGALTIAQDGKIQLDRQPIDQMTEEQEIAGDRLQVADQDSSSLFNLPRLLEIEVRTAGAPNRVQGVRLSRDVIVRTSGRQPGRSSEALALQEDQFYLLGDNQPISTDSRVAGPVPLSQILGRMH